MQLGGKPNGSVLKIVLLILALAIVAGASWYIYKKTRPKPPDPQLAGINTESVPPPGIEPFDPKPLMAKLTARLTADKFRFVVMGDSKHAATLPPFIKYMDETVNPDFVLSTGDMVKAGGGKVGPGYYQLLTDEAGKDMRKRPWWPAIGNHEVAGNPVITGSKNEGEQLKSNQQTGVENFKRFYNLEDDHYSFTCRNCAFIALPFPQPVGSQIQWLEAELKKASDAKKHIFIFNHMCYFTVGSKNSTDVPNKETEITALFKKYGVAAVFSGHDHGYYRTIRNGIPYMISAGGGAAIYPAKRKSEALPDDVYYYCVPDTFNKPEPEKRFMLHKNDGSPDKITEVADQFMNVVDVNGDKINCFTVTAKGEKWDELQLSK